DESAAGPWPAWAVPQLQAAVKVATRAAAQRDGRERAVRLYREWYSPVTDRPAGSLPGATPLAGQYRRAHAGSSVKLRVDGVLVVGRHDVVGRDGWWRTWGDAWRPLRSRRQCVRVLFTPRADALALFVHALTAGLGGAEFPWLLACPTAPRATRRPGHAVLHVPDAGYLGGLLAELVPLLEDTRPPLSLPLAPGVGLAADPDNGMTFGEHRCHLIALALAPQHAREAPFEAIAEAFRTHGVDPAEPYRSS
ncbi:MAG: T3SS effector HopA1 family protein, partial [Jatrophihabitantaceae bacterium]